MNYRDTRISKSKLCSDVKRGLRPSRIIGGLSLTGFKKMSFLLGIVLLLLVIFFPGFSKIQELRQENKELDEKIVNIEGENLSFEQEKTKLETDSLYVEKVARQKMGIAKKDEIIYRILPEE